MFVAEGGCGFFDVARGGEFAAIVGEGERQLLSMPREGVTIIVGGSGGEGAAIVGEGEKLI